MIVEIDNNSTVSAFGDANAANTTTTNFAVTHRAD